MSSAVGKGGTGKSGIGSADLKSDAARLRKLHKTSSKWVM